MTLQYKHKYIWHKWGRFLNILLVLLLSLSACSDYERSIYDPNSPNYIGDRYVPIEIQTIDKVLESGETPDSVKVKATVVAANTRSLLLSDETGYILVSIEEESGDTRHAASDDATRSAGSYTIGDVVTVEGVVTSDAGLLQFPNTSKIQKVGIAEVVYPEPEVWNGAAFYNYFDRISVRYVKYTGVLSKENDDYIVTVSDSTTTAVGQITYPASDLVNASDEGEKVQVIGYAIGYTDNKYVRTMVTSIKVVGKPDEEPKEEPSFSTELYIIGNDFGKWDWASDGVVEMIPVHSHPGHFWAIRHMTTATEFKFCALREWNGDFTGLGNDSGYIISGSCMVEADGIYMIYVDLENNCVIVEPANVYGIGNSFGGWDAAMDENKFVAEGITLVSPAIVTDGNIRMYAAAPTAVEGIDWWQMEFNLFDGKIVYRGTGGDQEEVAATVGQKVTLDFNAGTGAIINEEPTTKTISEVLSIGEGKPVKTQGAIVATHAHGILLHDETGYIHVRLDANTDNVVGDVVTVKGNLTPWGGLLEFAAGATIEKVGTTEVVHPEPVVWDGAALDSYLTFPKIQYVQYTGVLSQNDGIYNVTVDGATTAIGSIDCPSADMVNADWIDKKVTVTGYAYGCNDEQLVSTMGISVEVVEEPVEEEPIVETIEGVLASGEGKTVKTQGTIVATHAQGILLHDETGYIHVRLDANTDNVVGDVVTVKGNLTPWGRLLEFAAGATIEKVSTAEVVHPEPVVWDGAALDSYLTSPKIQYVQYTGTLSQNDGIYSVTVDGATTAVARVLQPSDGLLSEEHVGQRVKLTGYTIGCAEGKYVETMATAVEVVAPPIKDMTIAEFLAAGEGTTAKVQGTIVATHTRGFLLNDGTGYIYTHLGEDRGYAIGDVVKVTGDAATLNGLLSFSETAVVEKVGTAEVVHPEPIVWDGAALESYLTSPKIQCVQYTGVLSANDGYYNITVDDVTTAVGRVLQPSDGLLSEEHVGLRVILTGYTVGCTEGKYVETILTTVEVVEELVNETTVAEAVDLGLSVKWASWNVGATKPEGYGGYYAWGETEIKATYDWTTYKYSNGSFKTLTKYCIDNYYGITDNKTHLDLEDDVAHVKWGDGWRMPTHDEITELCNDCSWEWTTVNAVEGYLVTGPNGNSIFLPASGNRRGTGVNNRGVQGFYWYRTSKDYEAYYIYFFSDRLGQNHDARAYGLSVRPVKGKEPDNVDMDDYPEDEDWSEQ